MSIPLTPGKRGVVLGCGAAGLSVVRFLLAHGQEVALSDRGPAEALDPGQLEALEQLGVALEWGEHSRGFVLESDYIVPSPGVPLDIPILQAAAARNIPLLGELALAAGRFQLPVIAITGSNGKTTVTELVGELLAAQGIRTFVGGNIGTPLLDFFVDPGGYQAVVLELSSFQLELAGDFRPEIAMILNISPDHLDRHHSLEAYMGAKLKLLAKQQPGDIAILGGDDSRLDQAGTAPGVALYRFGHGATSEARVCGDIIELTLERDAARSVPPPERYRLEQTSLATAVNRLNAAAALLAVRLLPPLLRTPAAGATDIGPEAVQLGLAGFQPPPHRMAEVAMIDGVRYINDSKATNVGALQAALAGSEQPLILIAGGRDKDSDFRPLAELLASRVRHLVLIGEAAAKLAALFRGRLAISQASSMEEAVALASGVAAPGDCVLLAPGCASFDMFQGYGHRGEVFSRCVLQLKQETETAKEGR